MDTDSLIRRIIALPRQFKEAGNKSIVALLKESGYFEYFDNVNENNIAIILGESPEMIDDWLIWSADKRVSSGWYILEKKENQYIVGYWPKNKFEELHFSDKRLACASFIKREIEGIRDRHQEARDLLEK